MSSLVSEFFKKNFPPDIINRGESYFREGRVSERFIDEEEAIFDVRGTYSYEVSITLFDLYNDKYEFESYCDCPYFEKHETCKHVWASYLSLKGSKFDFEAYKILNKKDVTKKHNENLNYSRDRVLDLLKRSKQLDPFSLNSKKKVFKKINYILNTSGYYSNIPDISFTYKTRLKSGSFSKEKTYKYSPEDLNDVSPADKKILIEIAPYSTNRYDGFYRSRSTKVDSVEIPKELFFDILKKMSDLNSLFYNDIDTNKNELITVADKIETEIFFKIIEDDHQWKIEAFLRVENSTYNFNDKRIKPFNSNFPGIIVNNQLLKINYHGLQVLLDHIIEEGMSFSKDDENKLFDLVKNVIGSDRVEVPENFKLIQKDVTPKTNISVEIVEYKSEILIKAKVQFEYLDGVLLTPLSDEPIPFDEYDNIYNRNYEFEKNIISKISKIPFINSFYEDFNEYEYQIDEAFFLEAISKLKSLGARIWAKGKRVVTPSTFKSDIKKSDHDWFELDSKADFNGQIISLPDIIKSNRGKKGLIELKDGSLGILPEKWLEKQMALAKMGKIGDDKILFHKAQSLFLDNLLKDQDVSIDKNFKASAKKIREFDNFEIITEDQSFNGTLREYQRIGISWMNFLKSINIGGILADDMGLGKTVQVLAHLQKNVYKKNIKTPPTLLIVPRSLLFNWKQECEKFTPNLSIAIYDNNEREKILKEKHNILISTYGIVRRDIETLKKINFEYIILDEAQNIKNADSLSAKSILLLKANHRLALTGTPIENKIEDIYSIFNFLIPGPFRKKKSSVNKNVDQLILKGLRPFILRRTKKEVLTDLPEKVEDYLYCQMSPQHEKIYNNLKEYYRQNLNKKFKKDGFKKNKIQILEALLRLRQTACHPGLVDIEHSKELFSKLELIIPKVMTLLEEKRKVIIFSQFTKLLQIVSEILSKKGIMYSYLDGQSRKREDIVNEFKYGLKKNVFLISIKAGGVGLNLTEADYCFILDPWWNPAVESQAIDRIHRIGQKNSVFAYKVVTKGTIEEKILKLQSTKRKLADGIISAEGSFLQNMTASDLEFILN